MNITEDFRSGLTAASPSTATSVGVALDAAEVGTLNRLVVVQTAGTLAGFSYSLYCARAACPPGDNPSAGSLVPELYEVLPTVTVAANAKSGTSSESFHLWHQYVNRDGGPSNRRRQLFLKITPTGGFTGKAFAVAIVTAHPAD